MIVHKCENKLSCIYFSYSIFHGTSNICAYYLIYMYNKRLRHQAIRISPMIFSSFLCKKDQLSHERPLLLYIVFIIHTALCLSGNPIIFSNYARLDPSHCY
jgi:hypothetical protein